MSDNNSNNGDHAMTSSDNEALSSPPSSEIAALSLPTPTKVTPKKPTLKKVTPKKRKIEAAEDGSEGEGENDTPKIKAKPKPKSKATPKGGKASSDDFTESDKIIINLRGQNKSWKEIDEEIFRVTDTRPGDSVSRKKYPRLQAIIAREKMEKGFTAEDRKLLMKAFDDGQDTFDEEKNKLEATFNQERSKLETTFNADKKKMDDKRWEDIKDEIIKNGGNAYEGSALKAKYAELKAAE